MSIARLVAAAVSLVAVSGCIVGPSLRQAYLRGLSPAEQRRFNADPQSVIDELAISPYRTAIQKGCLAIGMNRFEAKEALATVGDVTLFDIHTTMTAAGSEQQWVCGRGTDRLWTPKFYLYFDAEGKLTAYQN